MLTLIGRIIKMISTKSNLPNSKYPEVRRDLALLIDHNVTYDSIYSIATVKKTS
jgi:phenylalanyl-tRNA synthetase beta chain